MLSYLYALTVANYYYTFHWLIITVPRAKSELHNFVVHHLVFQYLTRTTLILSQNCFYFLTVLGRYLVVHLISMITLIGLTMKEQHRMYRLYIFIHKMCRPLTNEIIMKNKKYLYTNYIYYYYLIFINIHTTCEHFSINLCMCQLNSLMDHSQIVVIITLCTQQRNYSRRLNTCKLCFVLFSQFHLLVNAIHMVPLHIVFDYLLEWLRMIY